MVGTLAGVSTVPPLNSKESDQGMARFVSPHRNYSHGVRGHLPQRLGPYGDHLPEQPELEAAFNPDIRTDEDLALAKSTFKFRGLPIYEDGSPVDPGYRVSVFDSEVAKLKNGWTDEEEQMVVQALREEGPIGQMYVEVTPSAADKPWNGYDVLDDADRIVELALGINADLDQIILYEEQNAKRKNVLDALLAARDGETATIIVSA
jgi:hypothetical protein